MRGCTRMFTISLLLNPQFAFKNYIELKEQTSLLGLKQSANSGQCLSVCYK